MNAVEYMAGLLPSETVRRIAALRVQRFAPRQLGAASTVRTLDTDEARAHAIDRWADDLCGLLNALTRGELAELAIAMNLDGAGKSPDLRVRLWEAGAQLERGDADVSDFVQPRPIVLGGHLVVQAAPRGMFPRTTRWPRPLPDAVLASPPDEEPETLDDLLAAADRAIGVRLGRRGRDKGAWGMRAAALIGIVERGHDEPDWRGDVEVKTVPVALDASGAWRIAEDPAIAMLNESGVALSKLQRTLWLVRANLPDGDATILSWYLLESDADIARLVRRYLHDRPKGPRGTDQRGLYLHKRFFADAGLLATLNGQP
ncbi:MAG: hypothetical protein M4D80_13235 [Myxococcota bacterium]|nr:hypothetical protein [Myxococcota bacterium]